MKHVAWLAIILLLTGCSKHIPVDSDRVRDEINNRASGKTAKVVLVDGTRLHRQRIELTPAALLVHGRDPRDDRSIPLDSLEALDFRYHLKGMGYGFLEGAALGIALSLPGNLAGSTKGPWPVITDGEEIAFAATGLGITGAVAGLINGYTCSYRFHEQAPDPARPRSGNYSRNPATGQGRTTPGIDPVAASFREPASPLDPDLVRSTR